MITRADHLTMEQMQSADAQQELADEIKLRASSPRSEQPHHDHRSRGSRQGFLEAATEAESIRETTAEEAETALLKQRPPTRPPDLANTSETSVHRGHTG